MPWYNQGKP